MTKTVVGTGFSGLVGNRLAAALTPRYNLIRLRRPITEDWARRIDGAHAVINLSGENIAAKRWTDGQKKELRKSRIETTRAVIDAIENAKVRPQVLINASAVGFYGPRGDETLDETAERGKGFLSDLCEEWENEALAAKKLGVRVVLVRTGIVLAKEGGALAKMLPPFKLGAGGPLGAGKQVMSWIHIEDEVGGIIFCLENPIEGPVNFAAPNAVTMKQFAKTLGGVLHRPAVLPAPGFALKLLLGEMAEALLLTGQRAYPAKLQKAGFRFRHSELTEALQSLLVTPKP